MQDAFQLLPDAGVGKGQATHGSAVERAGGRHDRRAKRRRNRGHGCATGASQFMGNGIGIDDGNTQIGKAGGDCALAAADATGQANDKTHDLPAHVGVYFALQDASRALGSAPAMACRKAPARGSGPRSSS